MSQTIPANSGRKTNLAPVALSAAFRQLKEHPGTTLGTAALFCLPLLFLGFYGSLRPGWGAMLAAFVLSSVAGVLVAYAVTVAAGRYSEGEDPGVGGLVRLTASRGLLRFVATSLLYNLILAAVIIVALIPFFVSLASVGLDSLRSFRFTDGNLLRILFGLVLSFPLLAAGTLFVYLKLGLCHPASALDGTGPTGSIKRSWWLTKGRVWDFFLLTLLNLAVSFAITIVVSGPAGVVSATQAPDPGTDPLSPRFYEDLFGPPEPLDAAASLVTAISGYLSTVLLTVVSAAIVANFYLLVKSTPLGTASGSPRMVPLRQPSPADASYGSQPDAGAPEGSPSPPPPDAGTSRPAPPEEQA